MSRTTLPLRKRLREAASEAMLDAAERTMLRKGYDRATMQQIAIATGCAAGTFYLYFKNKEELLQAIVARHARAMFEPALAVLDGAGDPVDRLRAAYRVLLGYTRQNKAFFRMFFAAMPMRQRVIHQKLVGSTRRRHEAYNQRERQLICEAQASGRLRSDLPPDTLQEFMDAVSFSLVERFIFAAEPPELDEQVRILWGLIINGMGTGSGHGQA